jgi:hypothetical protein
MLGSACFLHEREDEDVLPENIGKLFSGGLRMPPAASELGFALCNFSEVL